MATLGFIGLGAMGARMSRRLLQKHALTVYDVNPAAVAALQEAGATPAATPEALAGQCEIIFTSLPNAAIVEQVVFGPQGLLEGIRLGSVLVELSSSRPATTRKVVEALTAKGAALIDAPVSRGAPAAENGTLSIMVGGDPGVLERCMPYLQLLGTDIIHVGGTGTGHTVKCLNNLLSATNLTAAIEATLVAVRYGVDPNVFIEIVNASSGRTNMTDERFPKYILPRTFNSNFSLGLMYKDVQTAVELAMQQDVPLFLADVTRQIYAYAVAQGMGPEDNSRIAVAMEQLYQQRIAE